MPEVLGYRLDRAEEIMKANGFKINITYINSYSKDSSKGQDRGLRVKQVGNRFELLVGKC